MVRLSVSTRWTITFSSRKSPSSVPWTACQKLGQSDGFHLVRLLLFWLSETPPRCVWHRAP